MTRSRLDDNVARNMQHETMFSIPTFVVAAAGSSAADAAEVFEGFNEVSAADDTTGVILPVGRDGAICIVKSTVSAKSLKIYPDTGNKINAGTANAAVTQSPLGSQMFVKRGVNWWSVPLNAIDPDTTS